MTVSNAHRLLPLIALLALAAAFGLSAGTAAAQTTDGRIVFQGCDVTTCQIYTVNPDGAALRQVTHGAAARFQPDWSPKRPAHRLRTGLGQRIGDLDRSRRWEPCPSADTPAAGILRSMAALHAGRPASAVHQLDPRHRRRHLIDPTGRDSPAGDHAEQRRVIQRCCALAQRAPCVHALACRKRHDAHIHEGARRREGAARDPYPATGMVAGLGPERPQAPVFEQPVQPEAERRDLQRRVVGSFGSEADPSSLPE